MKPQPDRELRRLVDGMLDGTLSRSEAARLEERMDAEPAAMDYYLGMAGRDALLADLCQKCEPGETRPAPPRRRWTWITAAAAAAVFAAIAVWPQRNSPRKPAMAAEGPYARLTAGSGVTEGNRSLAKGAVFGEDSGGLSIGPGLAEITHRSGTRLLIEGPAFYQATGPNSGRLGFGKLVAEVPPGAEGYTVEWADGKVVDLGTEFAIDVPDGEGPAEVGVFRGEVRVLPGDRPERDGAPLYTGHAVRLSGGNTSGMRSIPFDQNRFVRQLPSRELPWFHHGGADPMIWNVSHLVWSPGDHLAVFKWMTGPEALTLRKVELLLDGTTVASDEHPSSIGDLASTLGNVYRLHVPPEKWKRGTWELRAWPEGDHPGARAEGIVMFEDGAALEASAGDFAGVWEYVHDGKRYRRAFHADGTCTLWVDGRASDYFQDARWEVVGGILRVRFPASKVAEEHLLRDRESLLFINQPYRNARREP